MADIRDRLVRSALKPPRLGLDIGRKIAGVVTGTELGKQLRKVEWPKNPRPRTPTSQLARARRRGSPAHPRGARYYDKGPGRPS